MTRPLTTGPLTLAAHELGIPAHMIEGLVQYLLTGRPVGGFLTAVLANDLREAFGRADATNRAALGAYVAFLMAWAPSQCWGSRAAVAAWRGVKETA